MSRHRTDKGKGGSWFLTLFALPFAGVGIGMLLFGVLPTLYDWSRMQYWQPVQAQLISASLNSHRGSKWGYTYSVSADYRYQVGGAPRTRASARPSTHRLTTWAAFTRTLAADWSGHSAAAARCPTA
jgi:hypothetical protein